MSRNRETPGRPRWLALGAILSTLALAPAGARTAEVSPPIARVEGSPFLLEETEVRTTISGPVAQVVVTQHWSNPNQGAVDGLYIFPLPEDAAVTDMSLRIGERVVRGEMRRREEARAA